MKWVGGHVCSIDADCDGDIERAHVRRGTDGGKGLKPSDFFVLPLCRGHHQTQHVMGEQTFEDIYPDKFPKGMKATALEYAKRSPSYFKDEEFRAGVDRAMEAK